MGKCYVAYEDKGSCGQIMTGTGKHNDLYIFENEESARLFVKKVTEHAPRSRIRPRIIGFWSEDTGNVFKTNRRMG